LGVTWYRPLAVYLIHSAERVRECDAAKALGLDLVLTIMNSGSMKYPPEPSRAPKDLEVFKAALWAVLQRHRPAVLVVENEQDDDDRYYDSSPAEYLAELGAAGEIAHAMSIKVTDGGMTCLAICWLVIEDLLARDEAAALDFANRTLPHLIDTPPKSVAMLRYRLRQRTRKQQRAREMLTGFAQAGSDYVNFHWYVPDADALRTAVEYLTRVTGLPAICNEMGQRDGDPEHTRTLLAAAGDLSLSVIYYSIDRPDGTQSVIDSDGTLRSTGQAFQAIAAGRPS
jgi:hypothetical protein